MGVTAAFTESPLAKYITAIRNAPAGLISNRRLLVSAAIYAMSGIPLCWDQGSSSTIPSLPGFQRDFNIDSGSDASQIANFVSLVYIGCGLGAALSFFLNDRIGRLWSQRLYSLVWIVGQMIATGSSGNIGVLYFARIVSGLGIGALTVTGPVSLVEIAPTEVRGLIAAWFTVALLLSLFVAAFTTYGVFLHIPDGPFQYRVIWFSPCIFLALIAVLSFFFCKESPRWLFLVGRDDEAVRNLVALRGLPADHPRVAKELADIRAQISQEQSEYGKGARSNTLAGVKAVFKETFTKKANLRRVQQTWICYGLAQLSGANSITSYFIPVMQMVGVAAEGQTRSLFLSAKYSFAKFWFTVIASFFFIDALGRRKSLFTGIILQMISDIYLGVFIKFHQEGPVSDGASQAAIALIFIHGFGYAVGLPVLPYVFGAEVWPNGIRSFGAALSQSFHWFFFFGVNKFVPPLLEATNNWGAFLFFAAWCFISFLYVYFVVPEIAGADIEDFDALFEGSWFIAHRAKKIKQVNGREVGVDMESGSSAESDSMEGHDRGYGDVKKPDAQASQV